MQKHAIDRWTDTTVFRAALLLAGLVVLPVLAMGVLTTVIGGAVLLMERSAVDVVQGVFALLSLGGALGCIGYARAHQGARNPDRHNITATLICLAAGVVTALVIAGFALAGVLDGWTDPWGARPWVAVPGLFAAANLVWVVAGIAWMKRLPRRYAERTGRAFDGLPALMLFVSVSLATAAVLAVTTL